jgi:hypothetical protein
MHKAQGQMTPLMTPLTFDATPSGYLYLIDADPGQGPCGTGQCPGLIDAIPSG